MKVAINNSPSKKYKFIKDYFLDGGGAIFKKNDIIVGKFAGNAIQHKNHSIPLEFVVEIPLEIKSENNTPTPNVGKYVFKEDFEATTTVVKGKEVGNYTENIEYITLKYKFKKGDVFDAKKIPVNAGINPDARKYNYEIITSKSIKPDGSEYIGQATYQVDDSLVSEATFLQKNKTNLLIAGVLVLGYFAYKKFKK